MSGDGAGFPELFPHRVCINLDRRPERWDRMRTRFEHAGLEAVERFPAVDGRELQLPPQWPETAGAFGCLQSHLAVVREARAQRHESVLIIEDDVVFAEGFRDEFNRRARRLPADWDMLFFGCLHHDPPTPVAPGIARLRASFSTLMYAVRQTVYDAFIALNAQARNAVDRNNWQLQCQFNCYCFMPHLAWVDESYSDAQGVPNNHWYIRDSMVLRGDQMKAMEKRTAIIIPYRENANSERGAGNVQFLARYYGALFSVLIVEQNERPHLSRAALPPGCEYTYLPNERLRDCYAVGLERFAGTKDYFIVNDGNVVCSRMEMRASLAKCAEHEAIGAFATFIDLDEADSDRVIAGREYDTEDYRPRPRRGRFEEYFTATKEGLGKLCASTCRGNNHGADLRMFDSPGSALCLFLGEQARRTNQLEIL